MATKLPDELLEPLTQMLATAGICLTSAWMRGRAVFVFVAGVEKPFQVADLDVSQLHDDRGLFELADCIAYHTNRRLPRSTVKAR